LYPAQALGCADKLGKLGGGYQADMLLLNHAYQVQQSWIAGTQVYPLPPL
jgi:N-acetylglucosamine-6-phosphate deacetylase